MKTERIVDNPENHGWELVGGKWIWASGRNTGHITDGDLNGETTVWKDNQNAWVPNPRLVFNDGGYAHFTSPVKSDDRFHVAGGGGMTRTPSGGLNLYTENNVGQVVIDADGDVGIGTDSPENFGAKFTTLEVKGQQAGVFQSHGTNVKARFQANDTESGGAALLQTVTAHPLIFYTDMAERMRIDSDGNVGIGTSDPWFPKANRRTLRIQGAEESVFVLNTASDGNAGFYMSALNDGSVEFNQQSSGSLAFRTDNTERMTIDDNGRVDITGSLYVNGTPKIGTKELIETLATLRASTLDETVDVRQALASACDKLIEKFEAMQDQVATQDIQE